MSKVKAKKKKKPAVKRNNTQPTVECSTCQGRGGTLKRLPLPAYLLGSRIKNVFAKGRCRACQGTGRLPVQTSKEQT